MKYRELKACIACGHPNLRPVLDLGAQPLANSYKTNPDDPEDLFPLAINVCTDCYHTQLTHQVDPDLIFKDYSYVSGTSKTQLDYFDWFAKFTMEYNAYKGNKVLDIGCNDGSQLNAFKDIACDTYGIDPAENLYELSSARHKVKCGYLDESIKSLGKFDIIVCQNAFAHNTDQFGFMNIVKDILKPESFVFITTSQADMILNGEFDTIYHEHLSYYTIKSMDALCRRASMHLYDVIRHPIHGNSFIFVISPTKDRTHYISNLINIERLSGLHDILTYKKYEHDAKENALNLREFIRDHDKNIPLVGLGAPAKGNTLLNYIMCDLNFIIDESPLKHGKFTPGRGIAIQPMSYLDNYKDYDKICFIPLAWNFFDEMKRKVKAVRPDKHDEFVKYFPKLEVSNETN